MEDKKKDGYIAFRLTDKQLEDKINEFREEYSDGSHGIVTWPRFCAFLGYSVEEVRECYIRGKKPHNAYNIRAGMLERFHTECRALTCETADKQQALAKTIISINYLLPEGQDKAAPEFVITFASDDKRASEAMK